jgi:hypothetical protein
MKTGAQRFDSAALKGPVCSTDIGRKMMAAGVNNLFLDICGFEIHGTPIFTIFHAALRLSVRRKRVTASGRLMDSSFFTSYSHRMGSRPHLRRQYGNHARRRQEISCDPAKIFMEKMLARPASLEK